MSDFSCAGRALIEARIIIPEQGGLRAWVEVDGESAIGGQVKLVLAGGMSFSCTVTSGGTSDTRVLATLSQGMGTLATAEIEGQHFVEATPRTIVENIVAHTAENAADREKLNPVMPAVCDLPIARWMRMRSTADDALNQLASYLRLGWWFDADGQIRIGELTYPTVAPDIDVFPLDSPEWKRLEFASDDVTVMPRSSVATEYGTYRAKELRYYLAKGKWRGTLYYA